MKECLGCMLTKELTEFHLSKINEDGRQTRCKACQRAYRLRAKAAQHDKKPESWKKKTVDMVQYRKDYNAANRDKLNRLNRLWYEKNREGEKIRNKAKYEKRKKDVAIKNGLINNPDAEMD